MLVGAVLRSPHPYARLVSVSTDEARDMRGVHAVVTADDLPPGRTYIHAGGALADRPVLAHGVVRFRGQEVAAVAAERHDLARRALDAIAVRYQPRRAPVTINEALDPAFPALHEREAGHNVSLAATVDWGDVNAAIREGTVVSSGTYSYPQITHASMERQVTVAWWHADDAHLELWTSTQSPWFIQHEVAHVLALAPEQVTVRSVAVGGGFGSKSNVGEHEAIAALLSLRCGRPVKVELSREEEFAATKSRHAFRTSISLALNEDGLLSGIDADILVDNGAYNHAGPSVLHKGLGVVGMLYRPVAARARGRLVDTAKVPGGPFRGYGMPQVTFALESEVDELARRAGIDPIELRLANANMPNETTLSGARVGTGALRACLEQAREAIGWDAKRRDHRPGRGLGVAVAIHGSGTFAYPDANRSGARVVVGSDGRVEVHFSGSDPGTGQRTVLAQIVAEELGVEADAVDVRMMDLSVPSPDMGAWSSRGTHFGGHAVRTAAREAAEELLAAARAKFGTQAVRLDAGMARTAADAVPLSDLVATMPQSRDGAFVCEAVFEDGSVDPVTALRRPDSRASTSPSYAFAAHAVEVEVDRDTGEVRILDYVAVHDAGQVLNPAQAEGQVVGGVVMGLGAALREELLFEQGRVVNPAYMHYGVPRAADVPRVRVIFVGEPEPAGPYGAKNVGEISSIPVAPAVANAVRDAIGVRVRDLPITPDKIVSHTVAAGGGPPAPRLSRRPGRWWIAAMRWAYPRGVERLLDRYGTRLGRRREQRSIEAVERPDSAERLHELVAAGHQPVGGGTELQLLRRQGLSSAARLVAVGGVGEVSGTSTDAAGNLAIGAGVTLAALAERFRVLAPDVADAIETIATAQIRTLGTVAGNLLQDKRCWFYRNDFPCYKRNGPTSPCYAILGDHRFYHATMDAHRCQAVTPSDLASVLTVLDAEVETVRGDRRRRLPLATLYTGPGETCLAPDEILWRVHVPATGLRRRFAFEKLQLWAGDFAVVSVALAADVDGSTRWQDVRVCLGGLAPTPWLAEGTARALEGQRPSGLDLRRRLADELRDRSHPLPRNAWKVHAACALAARAGDRLTVTGQP
jgi:CO/xanthine dehydrogenase Mo-binding subunit/CO/xanthine dehydrogenase FAD-binding subunit